MTNLFQSGMFKLASGTVSRFKIECDALTPNDWEALAEQIANRCEEFGAVLGVPTGGEPLAEALKGYRSRGALLVVDDVLTTGDSILATLRHHRNYLGGVTGWVVFARGPCPAGVHALFQMAPI
jgi:orotate phosphoribosyltransferase